MTPRFQFGQPAPRDSEIVKRATGLKINLFRDSDGDVHGDVTIRCGFGCFGVEEDGDYDAERKQADALRFAAELLRQFTTKPDDAMGAAG